jgi:predicted secreted acid phosphatase
MQRTHNFYRYFIASVCGLLLGFNAQSEPANLDALREQVVEYHDSGAYNRDIVAVARRAIQFIRQRAAENRHLKQPQKLAIVLDIDETSLSNYHYMLKRQFIATKPQLVKEIHEANAPAIKPILYVYHYALEHHVAVFFVTGRHEPERQATLANLKKAGFKHWSGVYFKPRNYRYHSAVPYKARTRAAITHQGYRIIATIGDQNSDLRGGYAEAGFKLPNPYYYLP